MSAAQQASPAAGRPRPPRHDRLSVALFGGAATGKTSLLGALVRAADGQPGRLRGHIDMIPPGMQDLGNHLYRDGYRQTADAVTHYVTYSPADPSVREAAVELIDLPGAAVDELLDGGADPTAAGGKASGPAAAALEADALILTASAASVGRDRAADFAALADFVRALRRRRGRSLQVAGLPVYLALTQCDKLAGAGDGQAEWADRVRAAVRDAEAHFAEFAAGESFGSVDVRVRPTAIRRPGGPAGSGRADEPFGVAELFRDAVRDARALRGRADRAGMRALFTGLFAVGLVAAMAFLAVSLAVTAAPEEQSDLVNKLALYRAGEGETAYKRLREGRLLSNLRQLNELRRDPDFAKLSAEDRAFVARRLEELQAYRVYRRTLFEDITPPARAGSLEKLDDIGGRLKSLRGRQPKKFAEDWSQTDAALLLEKWLHDIDLLRDAVLKMQAWYREKLIAPGGELLDARAVDGRWLGAVSRLRQLAASPPIPDTVDPLRDDRKAVPLPVPGGVPVKNAAVYTFRRVAQARARWEKRADRLKQFKGLAVAVDLVAAGSNAPEAALAVGKLPAGTDPVSRAADKLAAYRKLKARLGGGDWSLSGVPEQLAPEVRSRLRKSHDSLIADGREMVTRRLRVENPDGSPSHGDYRAAAAWLEGPGPRPWRELLAVIEGLLEPGRRSAVRRFSSFVNRGEFSLKFDTVLIEIPLGVAEQRLFPAGPLEIKQRRGGKLIAEVTLDKPDGRGSDEFYRFRAGGTGEIKYRPGDDMWMEVKVKQAGEDKPRRMLLWYSSRSYVYQFETLLNPPRLVKGYGEYAERPPARAVRVRFVPRTAVPDMPGLFPEGG